MGRVRGFGELEADIMDRLWNRDPDTDTTSPPSERGGRALVRGSPRG